jgi:Na+/H+ antiporter NhaD/arsenite permease-like protein
LPTAAARHAAERIRLAGTGLMALAVGVFVIALGLIATEKLHRTPVALAGAVVVVASQTIAQAQARAPASP